MKAPPRDLMNTMQRGILTLFCYDDKPNDIGLENVLRQCLQLMSNMPVLAIYAYQALKEELESCDELRFIFTSPTFVAEKTPKERREFYIPRLQREKSLYGTEFEVRLRNELKQKAVAKA